MSNTVFNDRQRSERAVVFRDGLKWKAEDTGNDVYRLNLVTQNGVETRGKK